MTIHNFSDREIQAIKVGLEMLRQTKQEQIATSQPKPIVNQYDILSPSHTLMYAITALAKITGNPVRHFTNVNPSQLPQPKTHTEETQHDDGTSRTLETLNQKATDKVMLASAKLPEVPPAVD